MHPAYPLPSLHPAEIWLVSPIGDCHSPSLQGDQLPVLASCFTSVSQSGDVKRCLIGELSIADPMGTVARRTIASASDSICLVAALVDCAVAVIAHEKATPIEKRAGADPPPTVFARRSIEARSFTPSIGGAIVEYGLLIKSPSAVRIPGHPASTTSVVEESSSTGT